MRPSSPWCGTCTRTTRSPWLRRRPAWPRCCPNEVRMAAEFDALFVGGGFFGCALALHLRKERGWRVLVVEREAELLTRASYNNQARVHNGYHYPRSLLTALRCRVNYPRFLADYAAAVSEPREKYYGVGTGASKVTAAQFRIFCERVG